MKVALIGGILDAANDRRLVQPTTEIVLSEGLAKRGIDVVELSPRALREGVSAVRGAVDVVHIHHPGRMTTLATLIPRRVPIVFTPHRMYFANSRILAMGQARMLAGADAVIALSPSEQASLSSRSTSVHLIPNGLAADEFEYVVRPSPAAAGELRLLFVGQLVDVKQVHLIIDALADLQTRIPVRLRIISHNPVLEASLVEQAIRLGVENLVEFRGRLVGSDLAKHYQWAHSLVMASESEALPTVITEAMMTGAWVVAPDVGGIRWQLDGWGELVGVASCGLLSAAFFRLFSDWGNLTARSSCAAQSTRHRFSADEMVDGHVRMYEELARDFCC